MVSFSIWYFVIDMKRILKELMFWLNYFLYNKADHFWNRGIVLNLKVLVRHDRSWHKIVISRSLPFFWGNEFKRLGSESQCWNFIPMIKESVIAL